MSEFFELVRSGSSFPIEYVMAIIALSVVGLAAFAIHAVHSLAKRHDK